MHHTQDTYTEEDASLVFLGLAPFLRRSLESNDLHAYTQSLLALAQTDEENPVLWMNLATGFLCLKMRDIALEIQSQALSMQTIFVRAAQCTPPKFRLLIIMTPGDLSENTPLDCLLENSAVELIYYYATPEQPLPTEMPAHDAVMVALSDSAEHHDLLLLLQSRLLKWPKPVINPPHLLPQVNRDRLSMLLQHLSGVEMPQTRRASRQQLMRFKADASGTSPAYPLIIRPVGSQAGRDLEKISDASGLGDYLQAHNQAEFYVSPFVDYSSADGQYRKFRIAVLQGQPFICHMAISSDWMVHYVNAGMYESAEKRAEEGRFMQQFDQFVSRHQQALESIHQRLKLDYFCIDCAETQDGKLLIFEIDHIMVVHAMDNPALFPFKAEQIAKLQQAFEAYLFSLLPQPVMEPA